MAGSVVQKYDKEASINRWKQFQVGEFNSNATPGAMSSTALGIAMAAGRGTPWKIHSTSVAMRDVRIQNFISQARQELCGTSAPQNIREEEDVAACSPRGRALSLYQGRHTSQTTKSMKFASDSFCWHPRKHVLIKRACPHLSHSPSTVSSAACILSPNTRR